MQRSKDWPRGDEVEGKGKGGSQRETSGEQVEGREVREGERQCGFERAQSESAGGKDQLPATIMLGGEGDKGREGKGSIGH